jgi:tRNA pseudouridine55 synthase
MIHSIKSIQLKRSSGKSGRMRNSPKQYVLTNREIRVAGSASDEMAARISDGVAILVDKPRLWTSFDVVNKIRRTFRIKKVGHAGTLDPMAEGLLIICTGGMTKFISSYVGMEKEYAGFCKLGEVTPSYDAETEVSERRRIPDNITERLTETVSEFIGEVSQIPPMYSAVKVKGRRLYTLARKGKVIQRQPRTVNIREFSVMSDNLPYVGFRVVCSKGTYIRTLIYDFGEKLGCGAHVTELRRTAIGPYSVNDSCTIGEIVKLAAPQKGARQ